MHKTKNKILNMYKEPAKQDILKQIKIKFEIYKNTIDDLNKNFQQDVVMRPVNDFYDNVHKIPPKYIDLFIFQFKNLKLNYYQCESDKMDLKEIEKKVNTKFYNLEEVKNGIYKNYPKLITDLDEVLTIEDDSLLFHSEITNFNKQIKYLKQYSTLGSFKKVTFNPNMDFVNKWKEHQTQIINQIDSDIEQLNTYPKFILPKTKKKLLEQNKDKIKNYLEYKQQQEQNLNIDIEDYCHHLNLLCENIYYKIEHNHINIENKLDLITNKQVEQLESKLNRFIIDYLEDLYKDIYELFNNSKYDYFIYGNVDMERDLNTLLLVFEDTFFMTSWLKKDYSKVYNLFTQFYYQNNYEYIHENWNNILENYLFDSKIKEFKKTINSWLPWTNIIDKINIFKDLKDYLIVNEENLKEQLKNQKTIEKNEQLVISEEINTYKEVLEEQKRTIKKMNEQIYTLIEEKELNQQQIIQLASNNNKDIMEVIEDVNLEHQNKDLHIELNKLSQNEKQTDNEQLNTPIGYFNNWKLSESEIKSLQEQNLNWNNVESIDNNVWKQRSSDYELFLKYLPPKQNMDGSYSTTKQIAKTAQKIVMSEIPLETIQKIYLNDYELFINNFKFNED